MLIRTQEADKVINVSHIRNIYLNKNEFKSYYNIIAQFEYGNEVLGRYSTEERCKEIIGYLLTDYEEGKRVFVMPFERSENNGKEK